MSRSTSGRFIDSLPLYAGRTSLWGASGIATGSSTRLRQTFNWCAAMVSYWASSTVCSSMLRNSRTLPGQL
ncbi:hypothetical protein D3C84_1066510 [compost metagenome]